MYDAAHGWEGRPSKAFGTDRDIAACAQVFADVSEAMARARPKVLEFDRDDGMWEGRTADLVRNEIEDVPMFLDRFEQANREVAEALRDFLPAFERYREQERHLDDRGRSLANDAAWTMRRREEVVSRLRAQESDPIGFIGGLFTGYEHDPEVRSLTSRLEHLSDQLDDTRAQFDGADDEFDAAVASALATIWSAEDVLYNNGWDKFWTQTAQPVLAAVKIVLEIASIVLLVAMLFVSVGTLAPLILAAGLLFVSAAQVAGTAAAGREVTSDMWLDLAINVAAVATLGAAHYAKGMKVAAAADKRKAVNLLKGKNGFATTSESYARLQNIERVSNQATRLEKFGRAAEFTEGSLTVVEGGMTIGEGISEGDALKAVAGGAGIIAGGADMGGAGGLAGDASRVGHGGVSIVDSVDELTSDTATESPRDWPGLDGLGRR